VGLAWIAPPTVGAMCWPPSQESIHDVTIQRCEVAAPEVVRKVAQSRLESDAKWTENLAELLNSREPGVVVTARVLRSRAITRYVRTGKLKRPRLGTWRDADAVQRFFAGSSRPVPCTAFPIGDAKQVLVVAPCCDVTPPASVPCLLGLPSLSEVPSWAARDQG
jgi:hypothetical protein